jgi:hypothetical protein
MGVLFAIEHGDRDRLLAFDDAEDACEYVHEVIEERWEEPYVAELDKAWDAIHRVLADGHLAFDNGDFPLNRCILGGRILASDDETLVLKVASEVHEVSAALELVTRDWFATMYRQIDSADFESERSDDEIEYTWSNFEDARRLWKAAASGNRDVIFSSS